MDRMSTQLVSIIVPVYNVELYVDECIASLVNQSYKNIEIILINDGSADRSGEKCKEWKQQDKRIRYFEQSNCGLSATRNRGICVAKGNYIMFVDSDDWVERTYVEKMLNKIEAENADLAICDYYKLNEEGRKQYVRCNSFNKRYDSKEEYMILSNPAAWNKMLRRTFVEQYDIEFFNGVSEDTAMFPILLIRCNKVAEVKEPLYFYRKYRTNSITTSIERRKTFPNTYSMTVETLQTQDMFLMYQKILYKYFLMWSSNSLAPCIGKIGYSGYRDIRLSYIRFLEKNFGFTKNNSVAVWGGYNLSKIARMTTFFADPYLRIQFSSICALGTKEQSLCNVKHRNKYRNFMIDREITNSYFAILDKEKPEYIMIDFVEERHDILQIENDFYTYSDALKECYSAENSMVLSREDAETEAIWKTKCKQFVEKLKRRFKPLNIILVRNYLAEKYSDGIETKTFQDIVKIKKINRILEEYYRYFEEQIEGITVIDFSNDEEYVTDKYYEYGCFPEHLNDSINFKMARGIGEMIDRFKMLCDDDSC